MVKRNRVRGAIYLLSGVLALAAGCRAQKPGDWAMQNAFIGPDSPIEVRAGSAYTAQVMYPVPDGPLFPLKAKVRWSIEPAAKGIAIDPDSGKITVDADVPHGAAATIHADVNHGQRKLQAKLFAFRQELLPLVGNWRVDPKVACGEKQEMQAPGPRQSGLAGKDWKFHVDGQFWVGRELGIAAGIFLSGKYEHTLKNRQLVLVPKWPANKQNSSWEYSLEENGKKLLLRPLDAEFGSESGCSYLLHLREARSEK
jgi:hypothetical protein